MADRMNPVSAFVRGIGTGAWLTARALRGVWAPLWTGDPLVEAGMTDSLARFTWGPLPTLSVLAALTGVIAGVSVGRLLQSYDAPLLILGALDTVLLREVLPLIVGVFASGSVSVELSSRLGAMSLAREIDAIEAMGHDPVPRVLGPPIIAVLVASPVHMLAVAAAALAGTMVPVHLAAHVAYRDMAAIAVSAASGHALLIGMAKALLFACLAFGVGATIGAAPVRVPTGIGRNAGRAFVTGLLAIFVAAALWSALS
ncbi:ABC transporter permease [Novosphingobium sp.]|uniref:MlaE family ABC transporter permease n=1 Tax=Novosphingobium sp. TaxID=1874826 RepID=UPI003340B7FA